MMIASNRPLLKGTTLQIDPTTRITHNNNQNKTNNFC
jgi:hypothetical protein